jgi:ankyrin repeat protein
MRSVFDEIYHAALAGAYILKPGIDDGVCKAIQEEIDPSLKNGLSNVSINVKGGPAKQLALQEIVQDDPENKDRYRSAAHLLMIRYGASPVYVAESACDEYADFLRANYGVIAKSRNLSELNLDDNQLLMIAIQDMSSKDLRQFTYQAAFHGYTGIASELSSLYIKNPSYSDLAANAAAGSHYRFSEQLWSKQSLKIAPIVEAALKTTDFVNPVIALFHLSFMGDAFRMAFIEQLKSQHPAYKIDQLSPIANNIHRFMQEGFDYEEALVLGISQTKGESIHKYTQAEIEARRGTCLFNHTRVLGVYKKLLERSEYKAAITLMYQFSECLETNISEFIDAMKERGSILPDEILRGNPELVACLYKSNGPFNFQTPIYTGSGTTLLHLLADPSNQHLLKIYLPIMKQSIQPSALLSMDPINAQGQTPLECAARNGHAEFCKFLIDHGASLTSPILLEEQAPANRHAEEQKAQPPQYGLLIDVAKGPAKQVLLDAYLSDAPSDSRFEAAPFLPLIEFRKKNPAKSFKPFLFFGIGGQQDRELKFANYAMKTIMNVVNSHRHESIAILSTQLQQTLKYIHRLALENKLVVQDKPSDFSKALNAFCEQEIANPAILLEENPLGNTPHHYFAAAGNLKLLHDADLTCVNKRGQTLLHIAAQHGQGKVCDDLIRRGASITAETRDGKLPIEMATGGARAVLLNAYNDAPEPISPSLHLIPGVLLISHEMYGARQRIERKTTPRGLPQGCQQLHDFCSQHLLTPQGKFAWQAINIMHQVIYHQRPNNHRTINAALKHLDIVAKTTGVFDIPVLFSSDETKDLIVAFELFRHKLQSLQWDLKAKEVSAASADRDSVVNVTETPLHKFIRMGNSDLLERALRQEIIDINEVDMNFNTPLHLAAQMDFLKACELLVAYKADLFLENIADEKTALAMARPKVKPYLLAIKSQSSGMETELRVYSAPAASAASAAEENPRFFRAAATHLETERTNIEGLVNVDLNPDGPLLFPQTESP